MLITILYIVHILCGILWAGANFLNVSFILPAVKASGAEGKVFMQHLAKTNKYPLILNLAAIATIISGLGLLDSISNHFSIDFFSSTKGIIILIGSFLGIDAYLTALVLQRPAILAMGKIGGQIAAAGGIPTEQQKIEMTALQKKMFMGAHISTGLIFLAVICMPLSKYWPF